MQEAFALSLGYGWVRTGQRLGKKALWQSYGMWWVAVAFPALVLLPPHVLPAGCAPGIGS